jgi:hypothetical protein
MSRYDLEELVKLWALEKITVEQMIGQVLLHLRALADRVNVLEQNDRARSAGASPAPGRSGT